MYRPLLFLAAIALATSVGKAQPSPDLDIPEPCRVTTPEAMPVIEKRRQDLEREIARLTAAMTTARAPSENGARSDALAKTLRASQEELLKVMFQIECARARSKLESVDTPGKRGPKSNVIEVTTYYATNRNRSGSGEPEKFYGPKVEPTFHYGRATVTIPLTHTPGAIELPRLWKLQRQTDPSKHFVLRSVVPLSTDDARNEMAEKLDRPGSKALLLFVHGYNMGFPEAAMRTAQLAHDLKFAGVPFFFSWPSANQLFAYWQDEEAAQLSEPVFQQLLEDLSKLPATDIYIVAHSMGNRIVSHTLKARVEAAKKTSHIREVLLAAPDINADLFRNRIAPKLAAMRGTRTTIYASSSDVALKASKVVHGFRRLGETAGGVFTYPGLETIDASGAVQVSKAYGHFYLMDNAMVLKDVRTIIEQKVPAKQRGLTAVGHPPNIFWRLR